MLSRRSFLAGLLSTTAIVKMPKTDVPLQLVASVDFGEGESFTVLHKYIMGKIVEATQIPERYLTGAAVGAWPMRVMDRDEALERFYKRMWTDMSPDEVRNDVQDLFAFMRQVGEVGGGVVRTTRYDPFPAHLRKQKMTAQVSDHDKAMGDRLLPSAVKGAGAGRRNKADVSLPTFKFMKPEEDER